MTLIRWILGKVFDLLFGKADELNYDPELLRPNPRPV